MNRLDNMTKGMAGAALGNVEIPSLKGKVSDEEWAARVDLAAAYRLVAHYGWDDVIFTHLSARVPGEDEHFLLNPYQLMFEEITASSLVKVNKDGIPVEDTPFITAAPAFTVHSAIHMGVKDAHAVMHLHTAHGMAVSAHEDGLLPLTQHAMLVREEIAYHEYEGVAVDMSERERILADLGDKSMMIFRNHGTLATGRTVGECFMKIYQLERACEAQVYALSGVCSHPPQGAPELVAQQAKMGAEMISAIAWSALLRKAYRLDPNFAT